MNYKSLRLFFDISTLAKTRFLTGLACSANYFRVGSIFVVNNRISYAIIIYSIALVAPRSVKFDYYIILSIEDYLIEIVSVQFLFVTTSFKNSAFEEENVP